MGMLPEKFIKFIIKNKPATRLDFYKLQRQFSRTEKTPFISSDILLEAYHNLCSKGMIKKDSDIEKLLTLKSTRSDSGIVVVSVLTKPYACPGKCLYCPSEKNVPKSYFSNEPAVMRAILCGYHPYRQMESRLRALEAVGHPTSKVSVRIIGGTWSAYPKQYQTWFVKELFRAANFVSNKTISSHDKLIGLQAQNELSEHRIVELSVETRQDYVNAHEILRLRELGITKVELGVQSIYDDVLLKNRRGHNNAATIVATKLLKDAGFKVSYQMMLNLPGATPQRDAQMFGELFSNPDYMPDHLKIYPLALVKEAPLFHLYKQKKFEPYDKETLINTLSEIKKNVPLFCRIERVIRDIPADSIVEGGAKVSNLRQEVLEKLKNEGAICKCIRCREIKNRFDKQGNYQICRFDYEASGAREIFLSVEDSKKSDLLAFLRLHIPNKNNHDITALEGSAIIREIHTYGPQVSVGMKNDEVPQHQGFGKKMVAQAEKIAKEEFSRTKIAVIAGVGVRQYFRKLGYELSQTYMVKNLL